MTPPPPNGPIVTGRYWEFFFALSSLLTVGTFRVEVGAPAAAPLPAAPTLTFQPGTGTAVQTALRFPSALDLNTQQPACDGGLKAHHHLLFPKRVDKHPWEKKKYTRHFCSVNGTECSGLIPHTILYLTLVEIVFPVNIESKCSNS